MPAAAPLLAAVALGAPAPIDPPCTTLLGAPTPRTFAVALPDGVRVTLLDRYGGYISRNRLFVQFTVRAERADAVASVAFVLDGRTVRTDARAPFVWGA